MFRSIWNFICRTAKTLLTEICRALVQRAKELAEDKQLVSLALDAVQAAATQGLTGEQAWVSARDRFTAALKDAGKELGNCAIDTTLQQTYAAFRATQKVEE
ncbi:MAG: hypothetical protein RR996_01845 [Alistipes sp.]